MASAFVYTPYIAVLCSMEVKFVEQFPALKEQFEAGRGRSKTDPIILNARILSVPMLKDAARCWNKYLATNVTLARDSLIHKEFLTVQVPVLQNIQLEFSELRHPMQEAITRELGLRAENYWEVDRAASGALAETSAPPEVQHGLTGVRARLRKKLDDRNKKG